MICLDNSNKPNDRRGLGWTKSIKLSSNFNMKQFEKSLRLTRFSFEHCTLGSICLGKLFVCKNQNKQDQKSIDAIF